MLNGVHRSGSLCGTVTRLGEACKKCPCRLHASLEFFAFVLCSLRACSHTAYGNSVCPEQLRGKLSLGSPTAVHRRLQDAVHHQITRQHVSRCLLLLQCPCVLCHRLDRSCSVKDWAMIRMILTAISAHCIAHASHHPASCVRHQPACHSTPVGPNALQLTPPLPGP